MAGTKVEKGYGRPGQIGTLRHRGRRGRPREGRRVLMVLVESPADPLLCPDGKKLSWGHYTEKPLWGTSAMCRGEIWVL